MKGKYEYDRKHECVENTSTSRIRVRGEYEYVVKLSETAESASKTRFEMFKFGKAQRFRGSSDSVVVRVEIVADPVESTDGADIHSDLQQCAAILDNNDAAGPVDRSTIIVEGVRVRLQDYRHCVLHQTDVGLRELCLLSTRRWGLRRPILDASSGG